MCRIAKGKQITILSIGDPSKVSTWSNVPYFLGKSLEKLGCEVHYVDIGPKKWISVPYDLVIGLMRKLGWRSEYNFFRSTLNERSTKNKIARALERFPDSLPIFTTFSFGANGSKKPYVLFCDRTFESYVNYFNDREPTRFERRIVKSEVLNMKNAHLIISLFPEMAESLSTKYGEKVKYYGNVVNLPAGPEMSDGLLEKKWRSKQLLFIGKKHYKEGLMRLLDALKLLNIGLEQPFHLHVIGLSEKHISGKSIENVTFHGYLNKSNDDEYEQYIQLLENAFLFINPNPRWASFSASCEAMSYSTPLIINAYPEFTSTFGNDQKQCWFLESERQEDLVHLIRQIADDREVWESKARGAFISASPLSWRSYATKVLRDVIEL